MLYKPDHMFSPDLTTQSGLAAHCRNQTAKHFELFCFSLRRAVALFAFEFQSCSIRGLRLCLRFGRMGKKFRQRTRTAAYKSPMVEDARGDAVEVVTPNVRAKRATTAGRQRPDGENVPRTTGRALVACRWRSA